MMSYLELSQVHILKRFSEVSSGGEYKQLKTKLGFQTTVFLFLDYLQDYYITNLFKRSFEFLLMLEVSLCSFIVTEQAGDRHLHLVLLVK